MFAKPSEYGGGSVFKPKDHQTALALLIEPKTIARQVPHTYNGSTRTRDEVVADIAIFSDQAALQSGQPTSLLKGVKVVHGMLTSTLERILGGAMVAVVTTTPTQAGSGYVFRDASPEVEAQVGAYYTARNAAASNAPGFD